jgi:enoyl-CoA hydratase/carnithine racemase
VRAAYTAIGLTPDGGMSWTLPDVLGVVLATGGASFAVAHNHPSGDPTPSIPDRQATARLREAAEAVGLRFLDHVVVTDDAWRLGENVCPEDAGDTPVSALHTLGEY